jgi:hypothetical protein
VRQQAAEAGVTVAVFGPFDAYRTATVEHVIAQVTSGAAGLPPEQQQELVQRQMAQLGAEATRDLRVNPRYGAFDVQALQILPVVEPGITPAPQSGDTGIPGADQAPSGG